MKAQAKRWILCLVQGIVTFAVSKAAFAGLCPLCRHALQQSGNGGLIKGFYWSILLIAGMPLLIFLIAGLVYYRVRGNAKRLRGPMKKDIRAERQAIGKQVLCGTQIEIHES